MTAKQIILAVLAMMPLAGCESPRTDAQAPTTNPPAITIQASPDKVRAAALKTMADRGYLATPSGADTLLFDRTAELGAGAMYGFLYSKEAWRRVRLTLIPEGAAMRVTASPALLTNRGTAFEREEADKSGSARELMQGILEKIREQAEAGN